MSTEMPSHPAVRIAHDLTWKHGPTPSHREILMAVYREEPDKNERMKLSGQVKRLIPSVAAGKLDESALAEPTLDKLTPAGELTLGTGVTGQSVSIHQFARLIDSTGDAQHPAIRIARRLIDKFGASPEEHEVVLSIRAEDLSTWDSHKLQEQVQRLLDSAIITVDFDMAVLEA